MGQWHYLDQPVKYSFTANLSHVSVREKQQPAFERFRVIC